MMKKFFILVVFIFLTIHKCEALTLSSNGNEWITASREQKIFVCKDVMRKKGKDTAYWLVSIDLYYKSSGKYGLSLSIEKVSDMVSFENIEKKD
ncbi:hypothetical protein J7L67_08055 [bacterium]|nr:hypothetical protein [bacterium]